MTRCVLDAKLALLIVGVACTISRAQDSSSNFMEPSDVDPLIRQLAERGEGVTLSADGTVHEESEEFIEHDANGDATVIHSAGICMLRYLSCKPPHKIIVTRLLPGEVHYYREWKSGQCSKLKCYRCPGISALELDNPVYWGHDQLREPSHDEEEKVFEKLSKTLAASPAAKKLREDDKSDDSWRTKFPLKHEQGVDIPGESGWHMRTNVTLDVNGNLKASTQTVTNNKLWGFTGGVVVALHQGNAVIYRSALRQYGVAGRWVGNPSDRTDPWGEKVPMFLVAHTDSISIHQFRAPRPGRFAITMRQLGIDEIKVPIIRHKW